MISDLLYHRQRASRELNLGLASRELAVARAHLGLSTLHHRRARELERRDGRVVAPGEAPPFVL